MYFAFIDSYSYLLLQVQPTIVNVQNERMTLSLLTTPSIKIKPLLVGEEVNATVCKILENGMEVQVQNKNVLAFIPLHHLSVNYDLNSILLGMYVKLTHIPMYRFYLCNFGNQ